MRFSVIGLGKLGASIVAAIASRGHACIGVDIDPDVVRRVAKGEAPVQETDLHATLRRNAHLIRATLDVSEAIRESDLTFVVVPTPSDDRGAYSLIAPEAAFRAIGRALRDKDEYHTVVLTSTVLPGATRHGLLPALEEASRKTCGEDFGLCYSPEFIALGSIIRDFLHPDFTLVGEYDTRSGETLEAAYSLLLPNEAPCRRMSLENAELTKICLNAFVTTKITFANQVAALCEQLPGGDVDVVTQALGSDRRIGSRYLRGGLGYGGPCFPRDNAALRFIAGQLGIDAKLPEATDATNRTIVERLTTEISEYARPGDTVSVLGLSYKPASHVVEESQSVELARRLAESGYHVRAWDPLAREAARSVLGDLVTIPDTLEACLADAALIVVSTPDPAFAALAPLTTGGRTVTVIDLWRVLADAFEGQEGVRYLALGRSHRDEVNALRLARLWGSAGSEF